MINLAELLDKAKKKALEKPDTTDGYAPKSTDELRFKKKHVVQKTDDRNGNKDDVFKATNVKPVLRAKERHGYDVGDDEKVYEAVSKVDMSKPGYMLKADPELGAKIKAKRDLEKKRQASYGDPSKGISKIDENDDKDAQLKIKKPLDRLKNYKVKDPSAKPLVGNQTKLDKNHNGKIDAEDFKKLRKEEIHIDEVLTPSMGAGAYISDFVGSKNPKFAGKSKKERMKQALAAYLSAKRGE